MNIGDFIFCYKDIETLPLSPKYRKYMFLVKEVQDAVIKIVNIRDAHQKPIKVTSNKAIRVLDYLKKYGLRDTRRLFSRATWDKFLKLANTTEDELFASITSGDTSKVIYADSKYPDRYSETQIINKLVIPIRKGETQPFDEGKREIFKVERVDGNTYTIQNIVRHHMKYKCPSKYVIPLYYYMSTYGEEHTRKIVTKAAWDRAEEYVAPIELSTIYKSNPFETHYTKTIINNGEKKMSKIDNVIYTNTEAAKVATQITAGKTINKVVVDKLKPSLPIMVRGYADTVLAPVLVANIVSFLVQNFAADNEKAKWAADAMMVAAMTEFTNSFNVESLISEVLDSVDITIPEEATSK